MQYYNLGFVFTQDRSQVALIKKNRPGWQAGKLNGIGGKTNREERGCDGIVREFFEETGVQLNTWDFEEFGYLNSPDWDVVLFRAFTDRVYDIRQTTDEEVLLIPIQNITKYKTVSNVPALITLELDPL